jgi:hypothetical protein
MSPSSASANHTDRVAQSEFPLTAPGHHTQGEGALGAAQGGGGGAAELVDRFHVGQRVRLKTTLAAGLLPRGATGTVTNVGGVGEIAVWVRMDQHFPHLDH